MSAEQSGPQQRPGGEPQAPARPTAEPPDGGGGPPPGGGPLPLVLFGLFAAFWSTAALLRGLWPAALPSLVVLLLLLADALRRGLAGGRP